MANPGPGFWAFAVAAVSARRGCRPARKRLYSHRNDRTPIVASSLRHEIRDLDVESVFVISRMMADLGAPPLTSYDYA